MAAALADLDPVLLVSSDLARARETAAFVEKATGLTAEEDERLREYDVGERAGLTRAEFAERLGTDASLAWDAHAHVDAPGAETVEQVAERIVPATREVLERLGPGETAVLVMHGAALRIALTGLLGWPVSTADTLETMVNGGWAVVVEHGVGRLRLSAYNVTAGDPPPIRNRWWPPDKIPGVAREGGVPIWGCGAVGSALAWHARGQGFESPQLHSFTRSHPAVRGGFSGPRPGAVGSGGVVPGMACKGSGVRIPSAPLIHQKPTSMRVSEGRWPPGCWWSVGPETSAGVLCVGFVRRTTRSGVWSAPGVRRVDSRSSGPRWSGVT